MRTKFSLGTTFFVACVAAIAGAHAAVTVNSENFAFTGNWPALPVAAGSYVPAVPPNIAAATAGATPFAIGQYGGPHKIAHLNDGRYGNTSSWITVSLTLSRNVSLGGAYGTVNMSFAGVALSNATPCTVNAIVFGRTAAGPSEYGDRIDGTMYLQVTTTNSVAEITRTDAAADAQWTTLGSFTTTDVYEHQFSLTPPLNVTGVRIVTAAGNCIDEIVVHGAPLFTPTWDATDFVWTNATGGAWSAGTNWAGNMVPSTGNHEIYFMYAPLSAKSVTVPSSGSDLASLAVDATPGTAEAVTFTGGPLNFWDPRTLYAKGTTVFSNSVRSWAEIRLNGLGSVALTTWGGLALSHPRLHASGTRLCVSGTDSDKSLPAQLPANPWMHLDASAAASFGIEEAGGVKYVQTWSDVRTNGVYASAPFAKNRPVLNTGNGLPYVDFGLLNWAQTDGTLDGQHLWWSATNTNLRAVFLVYSDAASGDKQNFIGSLANGLPFHRGPGGRFFDPGASAYLRSGIQTLDGTPVNGVETILPAGFHVIGLTTQGGGVKGDVFARDNLGHAGGQKLSEVVLYDRELTPAESQAAEAYLLYKWFGSARPGYADSAGQVALLTLTNSATLEVQTDFRALELRIDGYASKEGAGSLSAGKITQPYGTFTLNGGTLAVAGDLLNDDAEFLLPAPWMHLDASDYTNSMTVTEADGTLVVEGWSDVRTNGIAAFPPWASSRPLLVTNGLNRLPYVDFGPLMTGTIAGPHLLWNQTNLAMRTVVLVYSDTEPDARSCFLGNLEGTVRYYRGFNRTLLHANASADIRNGRITLDGKAAEPSTYMAAGFHVFSSVTATGVRSDVFARDKTGWTGGQKLAEVLIYNVPLTDAQLRLVEQRLMRKWLACDRLGYASTLPAPAPAPDAWLHLDAADTNSLALVESGGALYVQTWSDVRTNGLYTYAPFAKNRPVWKAGNSFPHVDFGLLNYAITDGTLDGQHLWWSQTNTNLRSVFLVYSDADSGIKQNFIGSLADTLPFARGVDGLFFGSAASAYLKDGVHSLDFARVPGMSTLLPAGFHVIGLRTQGGGVKGDVFARDRDTHAGGQKLAEVLLYDRPLDDAEFAATGSYLMRKWFGAVTEQDSEINRLKGLADTALDVGTGRTLTCKTTEIAGSLEKRGAGRLMITTGSASNLSVLGGELWIEKPFTAAGGGMIATLALSNNATVNLMQNALNAQALTGEGTVSNGTVTAMDITPGTLGGSPQTLTIAGDLVLTAGCEIDADATADACDLIAVSGTLTLPANGRVRVTFPQGARLPASQHLCTFGTLSGAPNLASWSVELTPGGNYTASLVLSDHALDIVYHPRGTVLLVN
jgi:hypothetical protein